MTRRSAVVALGAATLSACVSSVSPVVPPSRESREIKVAEYAVLSGVAVSAATARPEMPTIDRYVSTMVPSEELGIYLIGHINSAQASQGLVDLIRFAIDGSGSRELKCYIAGSRIQERIRLLEAVSANDLRAKCLAEFRALQADHPAAFQRLPEGRVCATTELIRDRVSSLLSNMRVAQTCEDGW